MRVSVLLLAFKKPSVLLLILDLLDLFALKDLIVLLSPPLLELLGEFWLFGTPLFSGAL